MHKTRYLQQFLNLSTRNDYMDNLPTLEILKDEYIRYLLELTNYDLRETARILDIPPLLLKKKLNRIAIESKNIQVH